MNELFGIDMTTLTTALVGLLAICLAGVAWIAWRRRVVFNLGVRNLPRRKAQTLLIVSGLMLSTLIITSALGVGDTVDHSITAEVYDDLGHVDLLVVEPEYVDETSGVMNGSVPAVVFDDVEAALAGNPDVDGVMPVLTESVSVFNPATRLGEPGAAANGLDAVAVDQFGGLQSTDGSLIDLASLPSGSVVIDETLAAQITASAGDPIEVYVDNQPVEMTVAAVAEASLLTGSGRADEETDEEPGGVVMPLAELQRLTGNTETLSAIAISNAGGIRDATELTGPVMASIEPVLDESVAAVNPIKQEMLDEAIMVGQVFTGLFLVVGLFSIAAGILLILLIFTMLAAERRAEMGMARAVGAQRGQLVQQFVSEGAAYSVIAGLVGAALGVGAAIGIGYGLRLVFGDFVDVDPYVSVRSVIAAYALGVVITFIAVVGSSWKISRLNVVAAVRDLPDTRRQRASWRTLLWPVLLVGLGGLFTMSGVSSGAALPFMGGVSMLILGIALVVRLLGVPSRLAFSVAGVLTLIFWLLPQQQFEQIFGEYDGDFEMFFLSGLFLVISATLVLMQNDSWLLAGMNRLGGLFRSKLSSFKLAVAYPGSARGRTGMTVAMFSLIVFSLVTIATINLNFSNAFLGDAATAGWDVRGNTVSTDPPDDVLAALEQNGVDTAQFAAVGAMTRPTNGINDGRMPNQESWSDVQVTGMDEQFIVSTEWSFSNWAEGYDSDQAIVDALLTSPNVAVVPTTAIEGEGDFDSDGSMLVIDIDLEQKQFAPQTVELLGSDGEPHEVTIIGVISSNLSTFSGLYSNQTSVDQIYGARATTSYRFRLADPDNAAEVAREIEAALLPWGVQGISIRDQLEEDQRENNGFFLILQSFMGLGMLVGVAAIGVIASRNVVERRQQIGVLRALGFQRSQVSLSFLIESAFIVGLGVISGTVLGLTLARNLLTSGEIATAEIDFVVPWTTVSVVLALAVGAALLMTWLPARQASRIAPAEALRYE